MKNGTSGRSEYRFDARSQNFFESEGYLVIRNALTSEQVTELNQAIDLVYEQQKAEDRLEREGKLNLRNSIIHHDAFLQLLDMPTAAPLAWQILNWNIQMITTHLRNPTITLSIRSAHIETVALLTMRCRNLIPEFHLKLPMHLVTKPTQPLQQRY